MRKVCLTLLFTLLSISILLGLVWLICPYLGKIWQPFGITLQLDGRPIWSQGHLQLPPITINYQACSLISIVGTRVKYHAPIWHISSEQIRLNHACWQHFLQQPRAHDGIFSPTALRSRLPQLHIQIKNFALSADQGQSALLTLNHNITTLTALYEDSVIKTKLVLDQAHRLTVAASLKKTWKSLQQGFFNGEILLTERLDQWPVRGQLHGSVKSDSVPIPINFDLQWQQQQGQLSLSTPAAIEPLLVLPWQMQAAGLQAEAGQWHWPFSQQPFSGTVQLAFKECQYKPQMGAFNGKLQTELQVQHPNWGPIALQIKSQAHQLTSNTGTVEWDLQGQGDIETYKARWQMSAQGIWDYQQLAMNQLSANIDQWVSQRWRGKQLQLTLPKPLQWRYQAVHFAAPLRLEAQRLYFPNGTHLRQPTLELLLEGAHPLDLTWQGAVQAGRIGPIQGVGTWKRLTLQGHLKWPSQSIQVLQPLLIPYRHWTLHEGTFKSQATFSASQQQGLTLNGHLQIDAACLWLKEGQISGLTLALPYRWQKFWQLGSATLPATLRIAELENIFMLRDIQLDAQGYLPATQQRPLRLSKFSCQILGGSMSMTELTLPQQHPSLLKVRQIDLAQLTTLLQKQQLKLTGRVDGQFPVYTNHPRWFIKKGWLKNITPMTSAFNPSLTDMIKKNNQMTSQIINWLSQLTIHQAQGNVSLDTLGHLTLDAQIKGLNPEQQNRPVDLHYKHQENLLMLWRSLHAADALQLQIEQQAPSLWRSLPKIRYNYETDH